MAFGEKEQTRNYESYTVPMQSGWDIQGNAKMAILGRESENK